MIDAVDYSFDNSTLRYDNNARCDEKLLSKRVNVSRDLQRDLAFSETREFSRSTR